MEGNRINLLGNQHGASVVSQLFLHAPYTPPPIDSSPGNYEFKTWILDLFLMVNEVLRAQELSNSLAKKQSQGKPGMSPAGHALPHHVFRDKDIPDKGRKCSGTHLPRGLGIST